MNKLLLLTSLTLLSCLSSCRKTGCTDEDSIHFTKDVKSDNTQCRYEGSLVFWFNKDISEYLIFYDVYNLHFYLNSELIGSLTTEQYRDSDPDCNDFINAVRTDQNLGDAKTLEYQFSVKSSDSIEIWKTSLNINANTCSTLQLGL
tara:strand:- start:22 stop:459 length:438 start_codon:yes stop_codon:yes gene_type:complete